MSFARRSAHDAPSWYRRLPRRAARQAAPPKSAAPVSLGRRELITLVVLALLALLAVVAVAAAISYSHMYDWAKINKEPEWRARLGPLSADGAILAGSIVAFADSRMRHRPDWLAYVIIMVGIGWSVFANVAHDWQHWLAAKLIAGWPPIAMAATVELLLRFARRLRERSDEEAERERRRADKPVPAPRTAKPVAEKSATPEPSDPATEVAEVDSLTQEMQDAGWAPRDYRTVGDAMLGYLAKVDPKATGADLHKLVAVPFFNADPAKDTGRGRQIVRQFKNAQAEAGTSGKE